LATGRELKAGRFATAIRLDCGTNAKCRRA
jgi:hypothetical protein